MIWHPECDQTFDMFMTGANLTDHIPGQGLRHECKPDKGVTFCFDHGVMDVIGNEFKTKKRRKINE
jgi:hypothetical protein